VSITHYNDEAEYQTRQKEIDAMPADLKRSMQELITTQNKWVLLNQHSI
jgi:hypothetical protein